MMRQDIINEIMVELGLMKATAVELANQSHKILECLSPTVVVSSCWWAIS